MKIEPIKLLKGSHPDTGKTGMGCFMNVIAYLNGEPTITDASPCVCVTVKPIAVWLNDFMTDAERPQLLPYIMRAMGSATSDKDTLVRRAWLCAHYAQRQADKAAAMAAWAAMAASAERVERAAMAAWAEYQTVRADIIKDTLALLNDLLPPLTEPQAIHVERINRLAELTR